MSLFRRKSEILGDDRLSCCRVLEDSAYLLLITRREIELIIKAEAEIQFLPRKEAMQKTLAARQRIYTIAAKLSDTLYQLFFTFSEEDNSYHVSSTIPTAAFSLLKELRIAFDYLLRGADISYHRLESQANQGIPIVLRNYEAQRLLSKSDEHAAKARKQIQKLTSRMRLTEDEIAALNLSAEKRADSVKWSLIPK